MTSATTASAIWARGLRKAYGKKEALAGVDLDVPYGRVFALLGPNGAGKTTIVQILTTLIQPDGGEARVTGHDLIVKPRALRSVIGVTGQFSAVDKLLTGEENLRLIGRLRHLDRITVSSRITDLVERFDLGDAARKPLHSYSGGMRRKLDLAMTLLDPPQILFLDEPTTGLDPRSRQAMWQIVRDVVAQGTTVFLTTQYLEEADRLADTIGLLDGGRIVAEGTPEQLKTKVAGGHIELHFADIASLDTATHALPGSRRDDEALTLTVASDGGLRSLRAAMDRLDRERVEPLRLAVHTPDLDDVFFALTGTHHREQDEKDAIR